MNCRSPISLSRRCSTGGFTMVEIAIAIGVIGFALVAIIGILPAGLNVQRDNRSETVINQDATFWLEAIRSGALELNDLANYVENVSLIKRVAPGTTNSSITYSNRWALQGSSQPANSRYQTGGEILGLITWAAGGQQPGDPIEYREVRAQVTAFSGSAAEKELDPSKRELSFSYLMRIVIDARRAPESDPDDSSLPFDSISGNPMALEEHFGYPGGTSLAEIQITFYYPYIGENKTPPRSQTFRALVARQVVNDPFNVNPDLFYFRP